ncbi:calmodulin-binding protein 60 B-like [Silene latifolia]|uniref:calmodulin-binding protein 60 B-like n=1 Tax=Silene latifolia TaxID=37657 RepID=UPI003D77E4DE
MVLKRQFDEEGSDKSLQSNHSQTLPTKFQKAVKYVMQEASVLEIAEKIALILEPTLRKVMKEELEQHIAAYFQPSPRRPHAHQLESSPPRGFQLLFTKKLPSTLFTNSRVEGEDHTPVQVQLVDANLKNLIYNGQLSSVKVEIVVLSGDFAANEGENWSRREFDDNIVRERDGKRPLLIGDVSILLVNGVAYLKNVSFTDNSSWIRCRKFRLGVRAVSSALTGAGIKEAVSEAFVVLDHRGESYQKHSKPSLDDPVWRLRKISKLGASRKKLESHGIKTVKDFLMHYYMNPSSLRNVLGKGVANRAWDTMVRHANDGHLDNNCYIYCGESENVVLLFNCVYKVVAVKFTGQDYQTVDSLDTRQKALVEKLKQSAFLNVNELVPVHSSAVVFPFESPTIENLVPFSSPYVQHGGFSMIDQGEPAEQQLDFNQSDTSSYPCAAEEGGYPPEDDSASQTGQPVPVQWFAESSFMAGNNSSSVPSDEGYNWNIDSPLTPYVPNISSELTAWEQDDELLTILTSTAHNSAPFQNPDYGVNRSPKARWCKIRAAIMWKIVRRNAAARRKGKFPFRYY